MKALIVENNNVVAIADEFTIVENVYVSGIISTGISTERGRVEDVPPCPDLFVPFAWKIVEGSWEIADIYAIEQAHFLAKEAKGNEVRAERDKLLAESDWTQLPDVVLSNKEDWTKYRQDLRDISKQEGFPYSVVFPTKPDATKKTSVEVL